jgi:RNA polymerase sigma factor (sigma-70 family)
MSGMILSDGIEELVQAARQGDQCAWDQIVERYMPLVTSVLRRYRLSGEDAADVSQTVWLRLVEHLDLIREPQRLPGWIVTTAKNEAIRIFNGRRRTIPVDPLRGGQLEPGGTSSCEIDDDLLYAERQQALRDGMTELRPSHRQLLLVLLVDPPLSYDEISSQLGIPRGSIGPTRARALTELRSTPSLRDFLEANGTGLGR